MCSWSSGNKGSFSCTLGEGTVKQGGGLITLLNINVPSTRITNPMCRNNN